MRILKFAHVDYLKCRRFGYIMILFPALSVLMITMTNGIPTLFSVGYCLFAGIILAAFPFNMESVNERGFLQMLPSRPGEPTLGHFLFGFLATIASFLLGIAALVISKLLVPRVEVFTLNGVSIAGMYPALLGAALVFVGLEDMLLSVLRYEKSHLIQLVRIIPAFIFFFVFNSGLDKQKGVFGSFPLLPGLGVLTFCLAVYVVLALIIRAVAIRRGE